MAVCGTCSIFFLTQIFLNGQDSWENRYSAYVSMVLIAIPVLMLKRLPLSPSANPEQLQTTSQHIRFWYPLISFTVFPALLFWPLAFAPEPFELWQLFLIFTVFFCLGAAIQCLYFVTPLPAPNKTDASLAISAYPWLRQLLLDKSLHAGLVRDGKHAQRTRIVAEEFTPLPYAKTVSFRTQQDNQEQATIDFFWEVYGQQFHCDRFTISDIPKAAAGKQLCVEVSIDFARNVNCKVAKPLRIARTNLVYN